MSISLRCPGCGKVYEVRDDLAGKQAKCKCGAAMQVPAAEPAPDRRQQARDAVSRKPRKTDEAPSSRFSRARRFVKDEIPRLFRSDPWRAVFGLVAVGYGSVAAVALLVPAIGPVTLGEVVFGDVTVYVVQAVLAGVIAVGGVLILKRHRHGPACAGLAAVLLCITPTWGILPDFRAAVSTRRLLPLLWLVVRYALPIALMVWCLREETRRERKEGGE